MVTIFSLITNKGFSVVCCADSDFDKHGHKAISVDIVKGVSDTPSEAIDDYCINYSLIMGKGIEINMSKDVRIIKT